MMCKGVSSPKGLRTKSARAVTGRRCPQSGLGEDFLVRVPFFFTYTTVTQKRKAEKSILRCEMNRGPNLTKNWHLLPNIGIFSPFGPMPNKKSMQIRCLGSFSVTWVPKLVLPPKKLGFLAQKPPTLAQNMHSWSFWAKYWSI